MHLLPNAAQVEMMEQILAEATSARAAAHFQTHCPGELEAARELVGSGNEGAEVGTMLKPSRRVSSGRCDEDTYDPRNGRCVDGSESSRAATVACGRGGLAARIRLSHHCLFRLPSPSMSWDALARPGTWPSRPRPGTSLRRPATAAHPPRVSLAVPWRESRARGTLADLMN